MIGNTKITSEITSKIIYNINLKTNNENPEDIGNVTKDDAKNILKALDNPDTLLNDYQNKIKNKILELNNHRGLFHGRYTARVKAIVKR
jgi:hypothetical protein